MADTQHMLKYCTLSTILTLFLAQISTATPSNDSRYCRIRCGNAPLKSHTLCKYDCQRGPNCQDTAAVLHNDDKIRNYFTSRHNEFRNDVALGKIAGHPQASNMLLLEYNLELERIAECYIIQCEAGHDVCRNTLKSEYVGQNIAYKGSTEPKDFDSWPVIVEYSMDYWKTEEELMTPEILDNYRDTTEKGPVNHWTQMIWAFTLTIGCARMSSFNRNTNLKRLTIICNYLPGGNTFGQPVYKQGDPCSKCPAGTRCDSVYTGLCSIPVETPSPKPVTTYAPMPVTTPDNDDGRDDNRYTVHTTEKHVPPTIAHQNSTKDYFIDAVTPCIICEKLEQQQKSRAAPSGKDVFQFVIPFLVELPLLLLCWQ